MGHDFSDLGAILASIRLVRSDGQCLADRYGQQSMDEWRKRCWYARPAHADLDLWYAAVVEVAQATGEPEPSRRDCERPRPSPVVFV